MCETIGDADCSELVPGRGLLQFRRPDVTSLLPAIGDATKSGGFSVSRPTSYGTALDLRMTVARWGRRTHARERSADGPASRVGCWSGAGGSSSGADQRSESPPRSFQIPACANSSGVV